MKKPSALAVILLCLLIFTGCGAVGVSPQSLLPATVPADTVPLPTRPRSFSLGTLRSGTYTNEGLGITCALDSNWLAVSAGELNGLTDPKQGLLLEDKVAAYLEDATQIADITAQNPVENTSFNIVFYHDSQPFTGDEAAMIQGMVEKSRLTMQTYAQLGIEVSAIEPVEVTFAGRSRTAIHTTATANGMAYYMLQLYDFSVGEYSAVTTLASYKQDKTAQLLELFQPIA